MSTRISKNYATSALNYCLRCANTITDVLKCKMQNKIQWRRMLIEIALRLTLWLLFIYCDQADPFIREIHEDEIWKYQFPVSPSYVPNNWLWALLFLFPMVFFTIDYCLTKNKEDVMYGIFGLSLSYLLTGLITVYLKVITGRPRPNFYFRCFPDGSGNDYLACQGEKQDYLDGRKSFPSGHASFAFSCMMFSSLYLKRKLGLFQDGRRGQSWQLCLCLAPLLFATTIAISRTCDYHHHYEDAAVGSLIGSVVSYFCYKLYFPKTTRPAVEDIH